MYFHSVYLGRATKGRGERKDLISTEQQTEWDMEIVSDSFIRKGILPGPELLVSSKNWRDFLTRINCS